MEHLAQIAKYLEHAPKWPFKKLAAATTASSAVWSSMFMKKSSLHLGLKIIFAWVT